MPKALRTTAPKNGKIATFPKAVQGRYEVSEAPASPDILSEIETEEGTETRRFVSNGQAKEAVAFQGGR
jgi:hypothetical protein